MLAASRRISMRRVAPLFSFLLLLYPLPSPTCRSPLSLFPFLVTRAGAAKGRWKSRIWLNGIATTGTPDGFNVKIFWPRSRDDLNFRPALSGNDFKNYFAGCLSLNLIVLRDAAFFRGILVFTVFRLCLYRFASRSLCSNFVSSSVVLVLFGDFSRYCFDNSLKYSLLQVYLEWLRCFKRIF